MATKLDDGRVLVTAGLLAPVYRTGERLDAAELYDPVTGTWTAAAPMRSRRDQGTATLLGDGTVLLAGGFTLRLRGTHNKSLQTTETYDPDTDTWTFRDRMNSPRRYQTATLLDDGDVLVAGGSGSEHYPPYGWTVKTAELYHPANGTWTPTGSMADGRQQATATLLDDGDVLVVGGVNRFGRGLTSAELYHPDTGEWTPAATPPKKVGEVGTATKLADGRVFVVGGVRRRRTEIYDPATDSWSFPAPHPHLGDQTVTLLDDGDLLLVGGTRGRDPRVDVLYDPESDTWTPTARMIQQVTGHTATLLDNGDVLVAGGTTIEHYTAKAELYHPATTP